MLNSLHDVANRWDIVITAYGLHGKQRGGETGKAPKEKKIVETC